MDMDMDMDETMDTTVIFEGGLAAVEEVASRLDGAGIRSHVSTAKGENPVS